MDAAGGSGGRLAYVRGLARDVVEELAGRHQCAIAISNPGNLLIVGGAQPAVVALCNEALSVGAVRADLLAVKIAAHTSYLSQAVAPFQHALEASHRAPVRRGRILLAGGDGARIFTPAAATSRLAAQVATSIDWAQTLQSLVELGVDRVLDLGPGQALADMMGSAFPQVASYAADGFHSLDGLRRWIGAR
jgi:[acyl-carrier-protein] S-malonyltransferase